MKKPDEILELGAETFRNKAKVYGDNWQNIGGALATMFPYGVTLKTQDDWNRMQLLMLVFVKLTRYCVNWEKGHRDSIHDAVVYAAMLEAVDSEVFQAANDVKSLAIACMECGNVSYIDNNQPQGCPVCASKFFKSTVNEHGPQAKYFSGPST